MDGGVVPVADGGGGGAGSSCIDGMQCMLACRANDRACIAGCINSVAPEHRRVTQVVADCAQRHQCRDPNCIFQNCQREAQACGEAGGGPPGGADGGVVNPPGPGGTDTCADFVQCLSACNPRDQQCPNNCIQRVRRQSTQLSNALMMCMARNQCGDMDCARTRCRAEMRSCMADRN